MENWVFQTLGEEPHLPDRLTTRSTYHSGAKEIRSNPSLRALSYDYAGATAWFEVAVQVAAASGWRPDCSGIAEGMRGYTMPPLNGPF